MTTDGITGEREIEDEEALKERVKAVLRELEDASFKNKVLEELREAAKKKTSVFEHPALLLVLGFLLTGVVGTWLASYWQSREQQKQQAQLAHERALQQKYDVTEQINKAVSEVYTGAHVVLYVISYDQSQNKTGEAEREAYWNQARRSWIINSLALQLKLTNTFNHDEAFSLYQAIIEESDEVSVNVNEVLLILKKSNWKSLKSDEVADKRKVIQDLSSDMREKTGRLLKILVDEIHKEEAGPENP